MSHSLLFWSTNKCVKLKHNVVLQVSAPKYFGTSSPPKKDNGIFLSIPSLSNKILAAQVAAEVSIKQQIG